MRLRTLFHRLPKWASDLLFALFLVAVYIVAGVFVLPRLGVPT